MKKKFYSHDGEQDVWHHPNRGLAAVSFVLLPERVASLNNLERLQKVIGKEMPVVLFPPLDPSEESGTGRPFAEKLFQPVPDVMKLWKTADRRALEREARKREYDGYSLDLFNMRRPGEDGYTLGPWQEALLEMLPFAREIQIGAGRRDIQQDTVDTDQELRDLVAGRGQSDLLAMLQYIQQSGWRGRIVTEIPAISLRAMRIEQGKPFSVPDLVEDHKQIVRTIQDILG